MALCVMLFIGSAVLVGVGGAVGENLGGVTMDKYNQIQTGMTYDEVAALIGGPGEEMGSSEIAGHSTVIYTWSGFGLSNATVTFGNGRVISKAQIGL